MRNSFKELEKLEMQDVNMKSDAIRNGISSDIGIMRFMTEIVEMYFPKVIDLFVTLSGGSPAAPENTMMRKNRYPDLN